jgi:hypothetical protein
LVRESIFVTGDTSLWDYRQGQDRYIHCHDHSIVHEIESKNHDFGIFLLSKLTLLLFHFQIFFDKVSVDNCPDLRLKDHDDDEKHQRYEEELMQNNQQKLDHLNEKYYRFECQGPLRPPQYYDCVSEIADHACCNKKNNPLPRGDL